MQICHHVDDSQRLGSLELARRHTGCGEHSALMLHDATWEGPLGVGSN